MLRLHDTGISGVTELRLRDPGTVSIYVCGPTVYDVPHIGHGRAALVYDILVRYLEWRGLTVRYVSNITDIDDKIIERAAAQGRSPGELAHTCEAAYWEALDGLGVRRPHHTPRATEYVAAMIALIAELESAGVAYPAPGGVYFDTRRLDGYGLLAHQALESLRAGERVAVVEGKRSPLDFVLWKASKPGEPAWESPWGAGRPGWNTECVVMSLELLGDGFDLHAGGLDLKFPHHENERAQAVALGRNFARHWMHHAFVEVAGEKMSKSLGNFTSLVDLLARHDGRAYRLLTLQSHYRRPMEVTPAAMAMAEEAVAKLDNLARRVARTTAHAAGAGAGPASRERFVSAMDDDLDTPRALSVIFGAARAANAALDGGDTAGAAWMMATVAELSGAVGLELRAETGDIDPGTAALAAERDAARAARDFARADALREQLQASGWVVEDTPAGARLHRGTDGP